MANTLVTTYSPNFGRRWWFGSANTATIINKKTPRPTIKGVRGIKGHPKKEAPVPYEESIHHEETTKEKINSRSPQLCWGTCSTNLCRVRLICTTRISKP
jgi:hypothetical protein